MPNPSGPLAGLKVIDLSHVMAGPVCTLMLADLGADVIKVERSPGGDDLRRSVPPSIGDEAASFLMMNRNKRGIALNLKTAGGKRVLRRLLLDADIFIENYRHGAMSKMGFGYEEVSQDNPGLIYCSISGFGRTGPYKERGGFDLVAQGMSGVMSVNGEGRGRPPVKVGTPLADVSAGHLACIGILAALRWRDKTGKGQMVETSLLEAGLAHMYWPAAIYFATGRSLTPLGSAHPLMAPYQALPAADGWITIGAANQANWLRLLDVLNDDALKANTLFATNQGRIENLQLLEEHLSAILRQRNSAEWLDKLERAGVPAGPVYDTAQVLADEQVKARDMVVETTHSRLGPLKTLGVPIKFSATPGSVRRGAPTLGQDSRSILEEHGFDAAEIDELARNDAVMLGDQAHGTDDALPAAAQA
jgi:crotonobetainyl-CoA:carnitine CoA-transferase CaiB-like acyl-CoA transferase